MQKRHFEAIARAVSRYGTTHGERQFMPEIMAEMIAEETEPFNAGYNFTRFIEACKPKSKGE